MIKKLLTISAIAILIGQSVSLFAADDQFIVSQLVTDSADLVAPTTPDNLTATPISATQIDLSWDASTDNVSVEGYLVYRDSLHIATTTLTSYSDSGLSPETEYSYNVYAFDTSDNISSSSATATATTLAVPVTPQQDQGDGSSGGAISPLDTLAVFPSFYGSTIVLNALVPIQVLVRWGETQDYELGSLQSEAYLRSHTISITDLLPSTEYHFEIRMTDSFGRVSTISNQRFTTLSLPDTFAPSNVTNLNAVPTQDEIKLTWKNPVSDFYQVRVVRSDYYYPQDPLDGVVVYEGRDQEYIDTDVEADVTYYYTVFTLDRSANFSSGAVTDSSLLKPGETYREPKLFANIIKLSSDLIHPLLKTLNVSDLRFYQDGQVLDVVDNTVQISSDRNLRIVIDYDKVPEILKTIAVTIHDPEDRSKTFSFLLRVNADKTAYEANVGAFERPGRYEFSLSILDYQRQGLAQLSGAFVAIAPEVILDDIGGISGGAIAVSVLSLVGLVVVLFWIARKRFGLTVVSNTEIK